MARERDPQAREAQPLSSSLLQRAALVRPGEGRAVLWAALFFFALMCGYFTLRPLRETLGIEGGIENLPWLYTGTWALTFLASPLFSVLVVRWPRRVFLPFVYRGSALCLLGFLLAFELLPPGGVVNVGRAFFSWLSVFNLFAVSVLGGFLADLFTLEQGKRLFALIGVGGTIGALAGSALAGALPSLVSDEALPSAMFGAAIVLLEVAAQCVHRLRRVAPVRVDERHVDPERAIGGRALDGIRHVLRSPFLQLICVYLLLQTFASTILYFQQAAIVAEQLPDRGARTAWFGQVSFATQALTLGMQLFLSGRILERLGIPFVLGALPLVAVGSFVALGLAPTLAVIAVAQVLTRGINFATAKPAREALYTLVTREERYKSKSFIDTFVYRGGDALWGWAYKGFTLLGLTLAPIAWLAAPVAGLWAAVGLALGRRQERLASAAPPPAAAPAAPARAALPSSE